MISIKTSLTLFTFLGTLVLGLSLVFYYIEYYEFMKWTFSFSGFFLLNKLPLVFSLCLKNIKVQNVSLLNIIFIITSQIFTIILNTVLGRFMSNSDNGGLIFFYSIIGIYMLLFILIFLLKIE